MELNDYIPKHVIDKLKSKGLSDKEIQAEFDKSVERVKKTFDNSDDQKASLKQQLNAKFIGFLNSSKVLYKGVVLGLKKPEDENEKYRNMSKLKEGSKYKNNETGEMIEVKEGFVPWGINIGKPIPSEPSWRQEMLIAFERNKKLEVRSVTAIGNWIVDSKYEKAVPGNVITIKGNDDMLDKKNISIGPYEIVNTISDEKFNGIIDTHLKSYIKTIKDITNNDYTPNELVVINGDVAEYNPRANSTEVKFTDTSVDIGDEIPIIGTYIEDVNFTEDAINVKFIGDIYPRKDKETGDIIGYMMNTYLTVVPKEFVPVETPEEAEEIVDDNLTDDVEEDIVETPTNTNAGDLDDLL